MLLDQETLRFIFGLKLRTLRQEKNLSLQELSKLTDLSPSYLNEIEKGKKYPKSDKISILANSLDVSYDDLISIKLSKELELLTKVLESNLLKGMPFEIYGISSQSLLELVAEKPQEIGALFGTVLELVRNNGLNVEDFFYAALRAYLDLNENHLPEIEKAASEFRRSINEKDIDSIEYLKQLLYEKFNVEINEVSFEKFPKEVKRLFSIYYQAKNPTLVLNEAIDEREKKFILSREIGFAYLKIKDRPASSASPIESFDILLNNLKGSYFASALLIPEEKFIAEIRDFFSWKKWSPVKFSDWVLSYPGTIESFFHRFSQILPKHFGLSELFYIRMRMNTKNRKFAMSREVHLSSAHGPHQAKETEHYCRRWVTTTLLESSIGKKEFPLVSVQKSNFFQSKNAYLNFCMVNRLPAVENRHVASTIGIFLSEKAKRQIHFLNDPSITTKDVADTCERCSLDNCAERAASPKIYERAERTRETQESIQEVLETLKSGYSSDLLRREAISFE